jgi:hypothetical protein
LRFDDPTPGDEDSSPLSAWAYIGPGNEVEAMFMSGHEQK